LADGSYTAQFDIGHPAFHRVPGHPRGGEVPFRAIDWSNVQELILESEWAKSTFAIQRVEGYYTGLRSRTFMLPQLGVEFRCFMICTFRNGVEIDPDRIATTELACAHVTYWMPDGSVHACPHYNCSDVYKWVQGLATGTPSGLMPATHALNLTAASNLS
jgi:hypothetical protein